MTENPPDCEQTVLRISPFIRVHLWFQRSLSFDDMRVGGVEHSYAAAVELEDQAFFGVHADAVAGEPLSIVREGDPLTGMPGRATISAAGKESLDVREWAMKIVSLIWLEEIIDKLEIKHRVIPEEVEQVLGRQPGIRRMKKGHYRGEDVYRALGQTDAGRYLVVYFIRKITNEALILSARDMDDKERRSYARSR